MGTANRIAINTFYLYANVSVKLIVSLYVTRVILASLGASDFGIYNVVGGLILMLNFLNTSMAAVTQRFMSYYKGSGDEDKLKSVFNISVVFHILIAIIAGLLMLLLKPVFFEYMLNIPEEKFYDAGILYYCAMLSTIFTIISVPYDAVLNAHENMRYYLCVGFLQSALNLITSFVVAALTDNKLIWYGVMMAAITIIVLIVMRIYCKIKYSECVFSPKKYLKKETALEIAKYSGWELLGHSTSTFLGWGSNIVLNKFFGTVVNAAAGVSNTLSGQLQTLSTNLLKAVNPVIVKLEGAGNRDQMLNATLSSCKLGLLCYIIVAIPCFAECEYILNLWLKEVPPFTVVFCQLLIILRLIEQSVLPLRTSITAIGNIKLLNIFSMLIMVVQITMMIIFFAAGFEPTYWVISMLITSSANALFYLLYLHIMAGFSLKKYIKEIIMPLTLIILVSFFITWIIRIQIDASFIRLIMVVLVSAGIVLTGGYLVFLNNIEKKQVKSVITSLRK